MRAHADASALVHTALLICVASVIGYAEAVLWPPLPVPGLKLGLANIAVIVALVHLGPARAAAVSLGRVFVVALASGTLAGPVFAMSVAGAVASLAVMVVLQRFGPTFSVLGWAVAGSAAHCLAQLVVAALLVGTAAPLSLAPLSLALSLPSGLAIGYLARLLISRTPRPVLSAAGR